MAAVATHGHHSPIGGYRVAFLIGACVLVGGLLCGAAIKPVGRSSAPEPPAPVGEDPQKVAALRDAL
jgi:hypothetical protein